MDQKTWLWRKRSSEKTIVANGEEVQPVPIKKVDLENSLKALNEKLASALDECSAKDKLVQSYEKMADDAVADKKKEEEEVRRLKEELDEVQKQRLATNERLCHLNSALKDCMEQLNLVRNEQEQRVHDAVMETSKEFERAHKKLEERLSETSQRLANATAESSYLSKALVVKEKLIEDLNNIKSQTEAEFEALMTRLDSTEKENAFLRYEFRTLEKELDLRNEEMEYSRRSAEASHKEHLENIKKIKKLEADCQRLRSLTRKRLPGPNVKSDIEVQERNHTDNRRRSITGGSVVRDSSTISGPDNASKKLSFLIDQLQDLEKENKILREYLAKKEEEIFHYQKVKKLELSVLSPAPGELSCASGYGVLDSNEISSSGPWNAALISTEKLDKFRDPQTEPECKMIGASDMSLMDDFVEMEKLAIVAVDVPLGASFAASDASHTFLDPSKDSSENLMNSMTKALVPVGHDEFSDVEQLKIKNPSSPKSGGWLQNVTNMILEQHNISRRSLEELLGDIKMALHRNVPPEPSKLLPISGYIAWKSPTSSPNSNLIQESTNEFQQSDVNTSIRKIVELVGSFDLPCSEDCDLQDELLVRDPNTFPYEQSSKVADYKIHVFRWKSSNLTAVLREFLRSCNNLLDGMINFEKFVGDLASTLGWIINNCISYDDHCTVREEFRKHLGGDRPGTALELECVQNLMLEMEKMYSIFQVEIKGLKNELNFIKSSDKDLGVSLFSGGQNNEALMRKLQQSQEIVASLQNELEILKESRTTTEDQIENLKLINEDLDTQLTVTRAKLNEALQKLSCVEVELDNKSHCFEELEGTCLELQLQLESVTNNQYLEDNGNQEELLRTGLEITKASAKLAECEETILKLGTQLKALGSAKELSVVDKVLSITGAKNKMFKQRSSLRDQMLSEDDAEAEHLQSSSKKEAVGMIESNAPSISRGSSHDVFSFPDGQAATADKHFRKKKESKNAKAGALVIVPTKKRGGGIGLLTKLLLRRKKASSKNTTSLW